MPTARINALLESKTVRLAYLKVLITEEDWHGVMDAAADIREIEAEIRGLDTFKFIARGYSGSIADVSKGFQHPPMPSL